MPVNTFGSNLKVETNVNGTILDNDAYQQEKAHESHNRDSQPQSHSPWAKNFVPDLPEEEFQCDPVPADPGLAAAIERDLRTRNLKIKP